MQDVEIDMYKLVIVEDERDVRKRLISMVTRSGRSFELAAEYETGIDAFEGIVAECPDMILTDIKIPYIDGIELIKKVREVHPLVKVGIITGYNELDYAVAAANLDVQGFINKPITFEALDALLKKAEDSLNHEFLTAKSLIELSAFYESSIPIIREHDLYQLSTMSELSPEFETKLAGSGIDLKFRYFIMCVFDPDRAPGREAERNDPALTAIRNAIGPALGNMYQYEIFSRYETLGLLLKFNDPPDIRALERCVEGIVQRMARYSDMPVSAGISSVFDDNRDFGAMTKEAAQALEYRKAVGGGKVFIYDSAIADNAEMGLRKVLHYMREHFCDPDISFETLARAVNFSVSYISALLKKYQNTSFVKMLTAMRMEKSRELLSDPNLKIIDIAEQLGYNDSYYFSHCFKRYFGVSPKEFRKR